MKLPPQLQGILKMKRSEKDFALTLMDAYGKAVTYQLPKTARFLKDALEAVLLELREREDREFMGFDRDGNLLDGTKRIGD